MTDLTQLAADMAKGTPGPWGAFIADGGNTICISIGIKPNGQRPCIIDWPGFDNTDLPRSKNCANARRIARLPELETAYLALTARVAELEGALWDIIPMTDEISRAPITAERWADRIEERARAALGEAKP